MRSSWGRARWAAVFCAVVLSVAGMAHAQGTITDALKKYRQGAGTAGLPAEAVAQAGVQGTLGLPLGKPSADVLPDGTWAVLEIPDLGATRVRAKDNVIYKILSDPQVKEYLKPVSDKLDEWFKKTDLEMQAKIKLSFDDLQKLANGRLTIALTGLNIIPPNPGPTIVVLLTPADPQHLNNCVTAWLSALPPDEAKKIQTRMVQGTTISEIMNATNAIGPQTLSWAIVGDTFVVGLGDKAIDGVLTRMIEGGLPSAASANAGRCLSTNPTYMAVREKMKDVNRDWMLYVSLEKPVQLLLALGGETAAWADAHLELQQFKALALAGKLDGAGVDDAIYLHLPGPPGKAAALLTPKPVDMKLLECVPADSSGFCVTRLNLPLAYDTVVGAIKELAPPQTYDNFMKGLDEAKLELGVAIEDEIVRPLGEELVVYHVPVPLEELKARLKGLKEGARAPLAYEYGIGRTVLMLTLKDSGKMRQSLEALTDFVVAKIKEEARGKLEGMEIARETYQGVELRVLNGIPKTTLRPAYAVTDRFLIVSVTPDLLKQAIDVAAGRGKNITESADWLKIKARIPEGAGAISVANPAAGAEQARLLTQEVTIPSIRPILRMMGKGPGADLGFGELPQKDPAPFIDAANRNAFVSVFTVTTEPDGVMLRGHSVAGAVPGIAVSGMINIYIPLWQNVAVECKNNLYTLRWVIMSYKREHNDQMPQTLEELSNRVHSGMFLCPATGHQPAPPGEKLQTDYEYLGILPAEFALSNVVILRDKLDNHADGIWYMEYDFDVKWAPRERIATIFQEGLNELQPWLDAQPEDVQAKVRAFFKPPPIAAAGAGEQ